LPAFVHSLVPLVCAYKFKYSPYVYRALYNRQPTIDRRGPQGRRWDGTPSRSRRPSGKVRRALNAVHDLMLPARVTREMNRPTTERHHRPLIAELVRFSLQHYLVVITIFCDNTKLSLCNPSPTRSTWNVKVIMRFRTTVQCTVSNYSSKQSRLINCQPEKIIRRAL